MAPLKRIKTAQKGVAPKARAATMTQARWNQLHPGETAGQNKASYAKNVPSKPKTGPVSLKPAAKVAPAGMKARAASAMKSGSAKGTQANVCRMSKAMGSAKMKKPKGY